MILPILKKIEAELLSAKEAAEMANQAKTKFISHMSHDIRTPLMGVVDMSNILSDSVSNLKQKEYAQMLCESSEQLLYMLNDILDDVCTNSANENDLHEYVFSLRDMIQNIIKLERPTTVVKKIELISSIDELIPNYILSDHTKIHRILLNLLGNAIKFTKTGSVSIGAKLLKRDKTHALIQFYVKDTGIGIAYELQDKVFDRFFRVTPSYKGIYTGHGVGLHIAQSYAHLLGGNILLTSEPNVGTTFYFDLSLKIAEADATISPTTLESMTIKSSPDVIKPESLTVLLVEDNAIALGCVDNLTLTH